MLKLDGAAYGERVFNYDVPAPFGPNRGDAQLTIHAKPAAGLNAAYRQGLEEVLHQARVMDMTADRAFEKDGDIDALVRARAEAVKWATRAASELLIDHCVTEWHTTIQSDGKDLKPSRANWLALWEFDHPALRELFQKLRKDLADFDLFTSQAETEVLEAEAGN